MISHLRFAKTRSQRVLDCSYLQLLKNFDPKVNGYESKDGVMEFWSIGAKTRGLMDYL